jgi:hypothetical protein
LGGKSESAYRQLPTCHETTNPNAGESDAGGIHERTRVANLRRSAGYQPNQIFLNNGKGFFVDAKVDIGKGGNKVAIADLNHDNLPDLLIVGDDCARVLLQFRP